MNLLIDDITAVASISSKSEPYTEVDLDDILAKITNDLKNKINEKRAVIESVTLPLVTGYRSMLEYLFLHLIDNALKFQYENEIPRVNITCDVVTGGIHEKKELADGSDYLKISFQDNGIGFNQEDAEKIFNLFEKLNGRKYHGSGVGLTIAKKIVEAHDGFIEGISCPGNGAVFNCYLPVEQEE